MYCLFKIFLNAIFFIRKKIIYIIVMPKTAILKRNQTKITSIEETIDALTGII